MTYARPDMPMVLVTWVDSASMSGWQSAETVEEDAGSELECRTVGYLFRDSDKCVTVVQSMSETGSLNAAISIPRSAVTAIMPLQTAS